MNNNISKVIFIFILFLTSLFAQKSKPQYIIRAERADSIIGEFTIELFPLIAPLHSEYFDSLVNINFYDSTAFHRVVPDFVVQGGDPNSKDKPRDTWGEGDSSQATINAEFSGVSHTRGIIGAARDVDINSASSQFYINVADNTSLDWNYTAFGQVLEGMDIVDFIVNVPRDENDNPIEKIEMFITKGGETNSVPLTPVINLPKNEKVGVLALDTLSWTKIEDAVQYHLEISKDENFDSLFYNKPVGYNVFRLPNLDLGNIKYFWRVKADNGGNLSEFSEVSTFYSSIEAPILLYPEMNQDSVSIQPTFSWLPVEGASGYRIQISRSPQFQPQYILFDVDTLTKNEFTPDPLEPARSHYWRVFSLTEQYQGPVSEFRRFVTPAVTNVNSASIIPTKYELKQNYPNPFNPNTLISFDLPQKGNVRIEVFDILGKSVSILLDEIRNAGTYKVNFNAGNLSSGIYYCKLTSDKFSKTIKMLLIK
ncbi:MAG: peptidylprolyl isomerase [Ignavibacteriales bacterium]|nr:peptidylprolyl isomerase [Ignavibacteriales bacterium]